MEKEIRGNIYELVNVDTSINTPCKQCSLYDSDEDCDEVGFICMKVENADKSWQLKPTAG
jgi:hypothetical protein